MRPFGNLTLGERRLRFGIETHEAMQGQIGSSGGELGRRGRYVDVFQRQTRKQRQQRHFIPAGCLASNRHDGQENLDVSPRGRIGA